MKKLLSMMAIIATLSFAFTGCTSDPCDDIVCLNGGGNCSEGICECAAGYEGDDCGTVSADKYVGNWLADETCTEADGTAYAVDYTASVDAAADVSQIVITNFGGFGTNLAFNANIDGNTITMPLTSPLNNDETVEGTGTISDDGTTISWTYDFTGTGFSDDCTGTWTKQ